MIDLKLKNVTVRNWMKFRNVKLEFPEKGLILVQGVNSASEGALLSIGSGKTGIGEAISRTLLGVSGRFSTLKQFSTDKGGNLYVKLEVELHGKPLVVELGYKCKEMSSTGEALRYTYDGKLVERGLIQQTRAELNKMLGVPTLLAEWTVFVDGDSIAFNKLSQADSVELVMGSLKQPPWNEYHEASKKALGQFKRSIAVSESAHDSAAERVRTAEADVVSSIRKLDAESQLYDQAVRENKAQLLKLTEAVNNCKASIAAKRNDLAAIEKEQKTMEDQRAEASHVLEIQMHEIEDSIREAEAARKPFTLAKDESQRAVTEARIAHTNYANAAKECPVCARPMGTLDEKRLASLADALTQAKTASQTAVNAWNVAEQKVAALNVQYRETSKRYRETSAASDAIELRDLHEEVTDGINAELEAMHRYELSSAKLQNGPSDSGVKTAAGRVEDRKASLAVAKAALEEAAQNLTADQATLKVLEYWNLAFSPYGIPNMVLRDAIAPLNKEARRVSAAMTGGTIELRYSTTRELASGLDKAQLNIEVDNKLGDKDLGGSSKGEAGLTNFIVAETLSEVGQVPRRVGYQWLDEVLPHQDPKVCHNIYTYLKEKANRLNIPIFLVDHNPVAANYADKILVVEKSGNAKKCESTVSWR